MTDPTEPTESAEATQPTERTERTEPTEPTEPATSSDPGAERRGTPAAHAASRARRIGGRPSPAPAPTSVPSQERPRPTPKADKPVAVVDRAPGTRPAPKRKVSTSTTPRRVTKSRPPLGTWLPLAILGVFLVAILAVNLTWLGGLSHPSGHQTSTSTADREKLLSQAKTKVALVASYDYRKIDADAKAAEAGMIEPFKSTYDKSIQTTIKPLAAQVKAIVTCTVQTAAISSVSGDGKQAVVLIYAQLSTQNSTTNGQPRLDIATIQVTMNKQSGNWLISNLARE
jgi:Mce-associated membrane protein